MNKEILSLVLRVIIAVATAITASLGLSSCGVTKATITKPAEGTYTTVTITTNNPMSTTVNPQTELQHTKNNN